MMLSLCNHQNPTWKTFVVCLRRDVTS